MGFSVCWGDLGHFTVKVKSKSVETLEALTANNVTFIQIRFYPEKGLCEATGNIKPEKIRK